MRCVIVKISNLINGSLSPRDYLPSDSSDAEAVESAEKQVADAQRLLDNRKAEQQAAAALLEKLGEPLMSVTLIMPGDDEPLIDPYEMRDLLGNQLDLVIDGGYCGMEPTTIVSFEDGETTVVRHGKGSTEVFSN